MYKRQILHQTIDGVAYSGLRYTYLLSPTTAGAVTVPPLRVSAKAVSYTHLVATKVGS